MVWANHGRGIDRKGGKRREFGSQTLLLLRHVRAHHRKSYVRPSDFVISMLEQCLYIVPFAFIASETRKLRTDCDPISCDAVERKNSLYRV